MAWMLLAGVFSGLVAGVELRSLKEIHDAVSVQKSNHESGSQSTHETLLAFEQMTKNMIASSADGEEMNAYLNSSIVMIKNFIDTMWEMYDAELNCVQERMNSCGQGFQTCEDEYNHLELWARWNATMAAQVDHEECRVDQCNLKKNQTDVCADYGNYRRKQASAKVPDCIGDGYLVGDYAQACPWDEFQHAAEPDNWEANLDKFENCLCGSEDWLLELYRLYEECLALRNLSQGEVVECDQKQSTFEASWCHFAGLRHVQCTTRNSCYSEQQGWCDEMCEAENKSAEARCADNVTGMRLKCLLDVLYEETGAAKEAAYNACVNQEYDTSYWQVSCPEYPPTQPVTDDYPDCTEDLSQPCDNHWKYHHYEKFWWYTDEECAGLVADCAACS